MDKSFGKDCLFQIDRYIIFLVIEMRQRQVKINTQRFETFNNDEVRFSEQLVNDRNSSRETQVKGGYSFNLGKKTRSSIDNPSNNGRMNGLRLNKTVNSYHEDNGSNNQNERSHERTVSHYESMVSLVEEENQNLKQQNSYLFDKLRKMKSREDKVSRVYESAKKYKQLYEMKSVQLQRMREQKQAYRLQAEEMKKIALSDLKRLKQKVMSAQQSRILTESQSSDAFECSGETKHTWHSRNNSIFDYHFNKQ